MKLLVIKDNIVDKILSVDEHSLNRAIEIIGDSEYMIFNESQAFSGIDIRSINKDGSIMSMSKQVELGYLTLQEDEKLDGENVVKLTQEELEEKFPDRYPKPPEPTELEKVENEIESMEYQEGYRLLKEMGKNSLLIAPTNKGSVIRDLTDGEKYQQLLIKRDNLISNGKVK